MMIGLCGCRGALIFGREDLVDLVNVEYYTKFCAMATCHYVTLWICRMFGPIAPTTGQKLWRIPQTRRNYQEKWDKT